MFMVRKFKLKQRALKQEPHVVFGPFFATNVEMGLCVF